MMDLVLTIGLVFFLVLILALLAWWKRRRPFSKRAVEKITSIWKEIEMMSDEEPEQAILKADSLLDFALGKTGLRGNMGEKLKKAPDRFSHLDELWTAHKLRNRLAHEVDSHLTPAQTKSALKAFQRAFHDLGISL